MKTLIAITAKHPYKVIMGVTTLFLVLITIGLLQCQQTGLHPDMKACLYLYPVIIIYALCRASAIDADQKQKAN